MITELVAYHEAGHILLLLRYEHRFQEIEVDLTPQPDKGILAQVIYNKEIFK